ncbi:MAG: metal-dependent transcriptional regulator [Bowdeniella nasicola]|nr:metal-dependent transcriptional regulator [Bowdeniella nasicola]
MSVSELSASHQNYLKAIWSLTEWSDAPVTPSDLAARVGVRLSTASDAVKKLTEQGLAHHEPYGAISLSEQGREYAVMMVRRHRLIETFLVSVLGYTWDQVHDEAETLEHAVSDFLVERLDRYLGYPRRDPHGDPIPAADGTVTLPDAFPLVDVAPNSRVRIERISDDDPGLLQYFSERGIDIGDDVEVRAGSPYSDAIEITVLPAGETLPLGEIAAAQVWVSPLT